MGTGRLAEVVRAYGLGELQRVRPLPVGAMNRSWRVDTSTGSYAVKNVLDVDAETSIRQHAAATALADKGFPVPRPLTMPDGGTLLQLNDDLFSVVGWVEGDHPDCVKLSLAECRSIGVLLGELQLALGELLPETPRYASTSAKDPEPTFEQIDRYLAKIDAMPAPDDFDVDVRKRLPARRGLLHRWLSERPAVRELGPYGWTHGDFHDNNLLWVNGSVAAVIDWDRLRISLLANELVRSASYMFVAHTGGPPDLERISAYASGYRSVIEITDEEIAGATDNRWWQNLTGLWPLDMRYERDDKSCDHLFPQQCDLLTWWCDNRHALTYALTGH